MVYQARAIEIMIASPGDVADERRIVREVIAEWNNIYARDRGIVLLPIGWETHSSPELAGRPQQMINERLLADADVLVGIFWTRVGSDTGKAISGSVEEINEHLKAGKPVMLYFSDVPVAMGSVDQEQFAKLLEFKSWAMGVGLVESFSSPEEFRAKFRNQLPMVLTKSPYLKSELADPEIDFVQVFNGALSDRGLERLSEDSRDLLAAAASKEGIIMHRKHLSGTNISAGARDFCDPENARSVARWEAALRELSGEEMIESTGRSGAIWKVTDAGYRWLEAQP